MKKIILLFVLIFAVQSCSNRDENDSSVTVPPQDFTNSDFIKSKLKGKWVLQNSADYRDFVDGQNCMVKKTVSSSVTIQNWEYNINPKSSTNEIPDINFILKTTTPNQMESFEITNLDNNSLTLKSGNNYYSYLKN